MAPLISNAKITEILIKWTQWFLQLLRARANPQWPIKIDLVVFDFDGVMTDNKVVISQNGEESVICHRGDGWGIGKLKAAGIPVMILSTEENPVVEARAKKLKMPSYQGIGNKGAFLKDYLQKNSIPPVNVVYLGNDENDIGCFELVGFPVSVKDGHPAILPMVSLILNHNGGQGAVRELCDRLIDHLKIS